MFGYVLPDKPELKIKDFELFKAYYCGICHTIGEKCGQAARLFLNYDCTFLSLVLSSLSDEKLKNDKRRCIVHPVKKRQVINGSRFIDYASDINVILTYYKLLDDWQDEKKLHKAAAMTAIRRAAKKASARTNIETEIIKSSLAELSKLEKEHCNSIDVSAEPFAKLLEGVFTPRGYKEVDENQRQLAWLGYNLGKWIYVIDAYDDIEKDIKTGSYNPIILQFEYSHSEDVVSFRNRIKSRIELILMNCLSQLSGAFELLMIKKNRALLENIVYSGLLVKTRHVLDHCDCKNKKIDS